MKKFIAVAGFACLLSFSAQAKAIDDWPGLVSRCSNASRLVTKAFERYPNDQVNRDGLIDFVYAELKKTQQLGRQTPTDLEVFYTKVSGQTLLDAGINPALDSQKRDWFIAQTAATCAIKASQKQTS